GPGIRDSLTQARETPTVNTYATHRSVMTLKTGFAALEEFMFDLKIIGGTVVDGTGAQRYRADVGIKDGKIVDVVRRGAIDAGLDGAEAAETVDATGRVVAPGFVDIHTHY